MSLPWGVEIYGLLTRWNPLNVRRPYALPYNGKNVLVVGLGPAGYTLAHYLVNEGFGVVGIDALKIEPLPDDIVGTDDVPPRPIRNWSEIYRPLDERVLEGFGGVSEYGITVRWDKNFLTLLHLTLARRRGLRMYGGVRFGGTMPIEDAWAYGFDHVAVASGAGRPTIIDMKNNLIRGIRKASDFLMALQLTGAFKRDGAAEPAGAPARHRHRRRPDGHRYGDRADGVLPAAGRKSARPVRNAGRGTGRRARPRILRRRGAGGARRVPRARSRDPGRTGARRRGGRARQTSCRWCDRWGGVTIAYRKRMVDSPAYRLNHEEVIKALEEGITFAENLNPDRSGARRARRRSRDGVRARGARLRRR